MLRLLIKEYFSDDHSELTCGISSQTKERAIEYFKSKNVPNRAFIQVTDNAANPSIKNYRAMWGNNANHLKTIPNHKLEAVRYKEFKREH